VSAPEWVLALTGRRETWREDEACRAARDPSRERIEQALARICPEIEVPEGVVRRCAPVEGCDFYDAGDAFFHRLPDGTVVFHSFDGSGFYLPLPSSDPACLVCGARAGFERVSVMWKSQAVGKTEGLCEFEPGMRCKACGATFRDRHAPTP